MGLLPGYVDDVLASHSVSFSARADEDCVTLSLESAAEDFEVALKVVHLFLTAAQLNPIAFRHWREGVGRMEQQNASQLEAQLAQGAAALLSGGDPRFRLLTQADARALSWRATQNWLAEEICAAPLEAAVVSDLESEQIADLAARYFGSLPKREDRCAQLDALRVLAGPKEGCSADLQLPCREERAALLVGWRGAPWADHSTRHRGKVAEYILAQRLHEELRERRRLTYSVQCSSSSSKAYPAFSLLAVACILPPARLAEAAAAILETAAELQAFGPSPQELEAVRSFLLRALRRAAADPRHLARRLAETEYRGLAIPHLDQAEADYLQIDGESVQEALQATCTADRFVTVRVHPRLP